MNTSDTIKTDRKQHWIRPALGALAAIATTAAVTFSGLSATFNALSLIPLMALFWFLERLSRAEMGFIWGKVRHYGLALLYPVFALGTAALAAWMGGAINLGNMDWSKTALNAAVLVLASTLIGLITEEGFFRGWLWSALKRSGQSPYWTIVWTSLAFAAWHLPIALLDTGFSLAPAQVPVYIFNVVIAGGVILGFMRLISGSVIVASVSHGIWNGVGYTFFGSGSTIGALGIQDTATYGPEVGVVGVVLNAVFAIGVWLWYRGKEMAAAANQGMQLTPGVQSHLDDIPVSRS